MRRRGRGAIRFPRIVGRRGIRGTTSPHTMDLLGTRGTTSRHTMGLQATSVTTSPHTTGLQATRGTTSPHTTGLQATRGTTSPHTTGLQATNATLHLPPRTCKSATFHGRTKLRLRPRTRRTSASWTRETTRIQTACMSLGAALLAPAPALALVHRL